MAPRISAESFFPWPTPPLLLPSSSSGQQPRRRGFPAREHQPHDTPEIHYAAAPSPIRAPKQHPSLLPFFSPHKTAAAASSPSSMAPPAIFPLGCSTECPWEILCCAQQPPTSPRAAGSLFCEAQWTARRRRSPGVCCFAQPHPRRRRKPW
jgi:hypothetical protein